jgi:hypothetical protein
MRGEWHSNFLLTSEKQVQQQQDEEQLGRQVHPLEQPGHASFILQVAAVAYF